LHAYNEDFEKLIVVEKLKLWYVYPDRFIINCAIIKGTEIVHVT